MTEKRGRGVQLGPVELDRCAGVLVGMAAGDALGAGYEFSRPPMGEPEMIGGGLGNWDRGEWTDDTQMAICIAEVAASGDLDVEAVGDRFLSWYHSGPADVGVQTSAVMRRAGSGRELTDAAGAYFVTHPRNAAGNGSLMRTAPVALAYLGDDEGIASSAIAVSALTHGDPLAGEACVLWCIAIDRAVRVGRLDGVRDGLALLPVGRRGFWEEKLAQAEQSDPNSFNPNGFVVDALLAAHAAISQTEQPSEQPCNHLTQALSAAVRIGDDTDTVAAIAGGLLGARWGGSAIPLRWRALLHGWPGYDAGDLVRLALLSARQGHDDPAGWPSAPSLLPYYESHFDVRGRTVALEDDPKVWVGDVGGLRHLPVQVDVVLSLCRIGRSDVPKEIASHQVWLTDDPEPSANPNLSFVLSDVASQIATWRAAGRGVFVHCVNAESRAPTAAASYLPQHLGVSGRDALRRVRQALPHAAPNGGFVAALEKLWPEPCNSW